jgi:hypothetical protein
MRQRIKSMALARLQRQCLDGANAGERLIQE